jgi:NAD(P)H-hydrate epimerase
MPLTREQARALDARIMNEFGLPGIVLMENAGRNMAELLLSLGVTGPVIVCCGKGNNGGDGFVIARYLDNANVAVHVLLFTDPATLTGDAAIAYRVVALSGPAIEVIPFDPLDESMLRAKLAGAAWILDGLFGTGLQGPVRPPFDRIIEAINSSGAKVFAIDIPSGLDCDTGRPFGATVRADHTATVADVKQGFAEPAAAEWTGQVHVIDFGAPRKAKVEG